MKEAEDEAHRILEEGLDDMKLIADFLDEYEELSGDEVAYILEHREMPPEPVEEPEPHLSELDQPDMPSIDELEDRLVDLSDHEVEDDENDEDAEADTDAANDNQDEYRADDEKPWKNGGFPKIPRKPRGP